MAKKTSVKRSKKRTLPAAFVANMKRVESGEKPLKKKPRKRKR